MTAKEIARRPQKIPAPGRSGHCCCRPRSAPSRASAQRRSSRRTPGWCRGANCCNRPAAECYPLGSSRQIASALSVPLSCVSQSQALLKGGGMIGALLARKALSGAFDALNRHDLPTFMASWRSDGTFHYPGDIPESGTFRARAPSKAGSAGSSISSRGSGSTFRTSVFATSSTLPVPT